MLFTTDSHNYTLVRTNNLQTIRPFPDPSFPFIIAHVNMMQLSMPYIPWHWHDELEFIWVKAGTMIVRTTEGSVYIHAGEGLFVNTSILHTMQTEEDKNCEFYSMRFYSRLLFPQSAAPMTHQYLHPILFSKTLKHLHLTKAEPIPAHILQLIQEITQIYFEKQPCSELMILSRLYEAWAKINLYAREAFPSYSLTKPVIADYTRVNEAIHFIAEHYTEPISLEDIAAAIHISKSECCRCFKRVMSTSPIEFLIQYRIMEAIHKMHTKETVVDSILELAVSVGFNSASYFNKQFKRYVNCTPLEYRKKLLSDYNNLEIEKEFLNKLTKPLDL